MSRVYRYLCWLDRQFNVQPKKKYPFHEIVFGFTLYPALVGCVWLIDTILHLNEKLGVGEKDEES